MTDIQPVNSRAVPSASPFGDRGADIEAIADRYGWSVPMARWWASFAACSVGTRHEAVIAFLDRTVGGVAMIRRR